MINVKEKMLLLPGLCYKPEFYGKVYGLNIWERGIDYNAKLDCEYIVGHSTGASVALLCWQKNKEKKLILVNPYIEKLSIVRRLIDWLRFRLTEGLPLEHRINLFSYPKALINFYKLMKQDFWNIIKSIPRENVLVIHGANDAYLCDQEVCGKLRNLNVPIIEVDDAGHNWCQAFDEEINKYIN